MLKMAQKIMRGGLTLLGVPDRAPQIAPPTESLPVYRTGEAPTVFHITHWKAGSQWINKILHALAHDRLVHPTEKQEHFLNAPVQAGKIYPTLYVTRHQFQRVAVPANHRRFTIIRDLRDTLISVYFSVKVSHAILGSEMARLRSVLEERDIAEGLLFMMDDWLPYCAAIQESWLKAGEQMVRYEELLQNDIALFERLFLETCELPVTAAHLREVVLANRFESLTRGRPRGQEDITAHERKGIHGDWQNYFDKRVKLEFKDRFGDLLVATGYEKNKDW
jgi:lipopolysaccharide transport system ATP-binding protein